MAYAETSAVDEPSADRRAPFADPSCGGCLYAHIAYPRQLEIKAQVIADAFARIGRLTLPAAVAVAASPEDGYRMRARLHVRGGRLGFFREGTHELCDARATRQLLPATCDALDGWRRRSGRSAPIAVREIELSENIDASERVVHLDTARRSTRDARALAVDDRSDRLSRRSTPSGVPYVTDTLTIGETHRSRCAVTCSRSSRATVICCATSSTHVVERVPDRRRGARSLCRRRDCLRSPPR